ncbi:aminotransferase class III-fold pyridoxal phosphate-dependent enzyme [Campylobacter sp. faydin G-140]|nr:aminotransferase class III-fold pyridoxal phosphate-dependent enzyme [Campylobacter anatolicus]MBR8465114.1 aminotransferase class III-fold pyridoxal phosphate-dependent enzyme [Campylobacter anatolicus]
MYAKYKFKKENKPVVLLADGGLVIKRGIIDKFISIVMKIYPSIYLKKLRTFCDKSNVLLIADEIATGFGRTGRLFACDYAGIVPDIMTLSKGLTGGFMPMVITAVRQKFMTHFMHLIMRARHLCTHILIAVTPLGCVAALGVLAQLESGEILKVVVIRAKRLNELLNFALKEYKNVGD